MSRARSIRSSPLPINRSRWSRKRLRADRVNDRLHRLKKDSVHNRTSEPSLVPPFNLPVRLAAPCRFQPLPNTWSGQAVKRRIRLVESRYSSLPSIPAIKVQQAQERRTAPPCSIFLPKVSSLLGL